MLVTGASGMVGRHLIQLLRDRQISFTMTSSHEPDFLNPNEKWVKWDLRESLTEDDLTEKFSEINAIFHVGALVPNISKVGSDLSLFDINVRSCLCLASWARNIEIPIIYLSGATVYADPFKKNILEDEILSYSGIGGFYGYSKFLAEKLFDYYVKQGLKLTILRASSIYGYGLSSEKLIMRFLGKALKGETIDIVPPINESINLIHAADVVVAMLNALEKSAWGVYNIAYIREYSVYEIAKACVELAMNGEVKIEENLKFDNIRTKFSLDIQKAQKAFDFQPQTDLNAGIMKIINQSYRL